MRRPLQQAQPDARSVSPRQPAQRDEGGPPQEDAPQLPVGHSERLEQPDHPRAFEHEDHQRRGHVEKGHDEHDDDDHHAVHVVRPEPVEDVRIALHDARGHQIARIVRLVVEQRVAQPRGEGVRPGEVVEQNLVARDLLRRPFGQPLHVAQIGQHHRPVHVLQPRSIDARDLEPVAARQLARLDEEHLDTVAHAQPQPVGQRPRQQRVLRADRIPHAGQFALREPLPEEAPVETPVHAFEHDALHGVGRADDAAPKGVGGHRAEALRRADQLLDMRAPHDGFGVERPHAPHVGHGDMARESRHLGRHLALETQDDGQRENHHGHAQRHRHHGDALHHAGPVLRRGTGHAAGNEKRQVHDSGILSENLCKVTHNFVFLPERTVFCESS